MPPRVPNRNKNIEETDHICVKLIVTDEKHDLFLLNGKTYSIAVFSLSHELESKTDIKGSIVETIINLEQGRPFPIQAEIISNSIF